MYKIISKNYAQNFIRKLLTRFLDLTAQKIIASINKHDPD
jgi:hypothetical protein